MATLRTATHTEAEAIAHIHVSSWRTTYRGILPDEFLDGLKEEQSAAMWLRILDSGTEILVAELNSEIVGFANAGPIREPLDDHDSELYAIYLLAEAQRKGIGTAPLRQAAKHLDEAGFQSMIAWMLEDNASRRFYERSGAVRVGKSRWRSAEPSSP